MCLTLVPVTVLADDDIQQINDTAVQAITPGSDVSVLSVVKPDDAYYRTYEFYVDGKEIDTQIVKNGDTLYEPPVTAPAGKTFTGWKPVVDFGTVTGVTETKTIRVDAQFEDGYHVYFKDNNGRIIATKTRASGTEVSVADVNFPVGSDEAITGWYKDADRTEKVESVTINGADITLYAKVEKGYWLTFESNGGSYVAPAFYANGTTAKSPDEPTKSGYTFAGWYTDEGLTTAAIFDSIKTSTTLHAKWTENRNTSYTVIHWLENADDDGYSYKESETKTGTTGGTTNAKAKSYTGFTAQTITQETIAGDGSTIVSVKYTRNEYEVKFYTKGSRRDDWKEDTSKRITAKYGANIRKQWPGGSWYVGPNSSTAQANLPVMPLGGKNFYGAVAEGNKPTYYYVEVLPGDTGIYDGGRYYALDHTDYWPSTWTVTKEDWYAITGFTFDHGTSIGSFLNKAKFYYTRNSYDIVFISGGRTVKTESVKYQASIAGYANYTPSAAPEGKDSYIFAGWYDNELGEGTAYVFNGKTMPAQNITLYAKWVAPTYTVTVHGVDGAVLETFTEVAKNSTISSDEMPALTLAEGETFLGWVQEDGTPFNFSTKINRDYDLYAKVGNSSRYTVTYHSNTTPDATVTDSEMIYAKDVLATVNDNTFTNSGKIFLSWNTGADGKGETYYPNGTIKVTGNMDLYAQWGDVASTVTVTYHSNFGTDVAQSVAAVANNSKITVEAYNALNLPERTGYSFDGWNTKADGTGSTFAAGASARVNVTEPNDLYAVWKINQYSYTVEYYIDNVKNDSMTETDKAAFGSEINSYKDKCPTGYAFDKVENLPLTIGVNESENVIKVFYKKNVFDLTIHYVYAEDQSKAADDYTKSVTFNDTYTVTSPTINGYTADKPVVSGTMPAENVTVTVTYSKRTDLSYTVHYYWNGTTESVKPSETFGNQTYQDKVTKSPAAIDGYTAVSKDSKTITIGTGTNVIIFYYYKNVELTANSGTATYDGNEHSVSGFTGAPAGADFSAITVGAKGTNVGTYPASFAEGTVGTVDANKKYIVTEANNGQLKINPVTDKVTVTIKGHKDTKTYNGTEYTVEGYDVVSISDTRYTATDFSFTGTAEAKGTNVKTDGYSMGLTAAQFTNTSKNFSNVKFEVTDGKLTINPRNVTLTSGSASKQYDGTPLTKDEVKVTGDGFADGEGATYDVTGAITNVADNKANNNTFTYTLNEGTTAGNYVIEIMYGTLEITPVAAEVTVEIKGHTTDAIYDATEKTAEGYDVISISNELYTANDFALTGKDKVTGIAAGKYDMGLAFKNISKNFSKVTFVVEDGKLTIAKRDVTVTGESATKSYNGQTQEITGYTVDNLVEGHKMTGVTYSAKGKEPGKYDGSFTGSQIVIKDADGNYVTENYNVKPVIGVLTITQPSRPTRPSTPTKDVTSVKTADGSQMTLWMSMMLASAGGIVFLGKKRKEER